MIDFASPAAQDQMVANLHASLALTDACLELQAAFLATQHPELSRAEVERQVLVGARARKEAQWNAARS